MANREIVGHGHKYGFSEARVAFQPDMFRVDGRIGFEIVHGAARTPRPRTQRAPILEAARLAMIHESDDACR